MQLILIRDMKRLMVLLFVFIGIAACTGERNIPDVSNINVQLEVQRFDKDFFAVDTDHIEASLDILQEEYPVFLKDFLYNILASPPAIDSTREKVRLFIYDYKIVYDSVQIKFASTDEIKKQVARGLQFVKHYFPAYQLPNRIITFIGPIEGYGNVLTDSSFLIGLQSYMGKDFPAYHSDYIEAVYPGYITRRFEPSYIAVNCIKNVIDYLYEDKSSNLPLVYRMIEEGKRLYTLDQLLPETDDSLKTGYTKNQLEGCYDHEALIWNFFVQNDLLFSTDPSQIRDYVTDGPKTEALGDASPGNIGQFVGWQIVKKWMIQHDKNSLNELMQTPAKQIFEEAKYKPR